MIRLNLVKQLINEARQKVEDEQRRKEEPSQHEPQPHQNSKPVEPQNPEIPNIDLSASENILALQNQAMLKVRET